MHNKLIHIVWFLIGCINSTLVPSVNNITLVPLTATNSTTLYNITCDQCLCKTVPTHAVLNCFPNNTCQYFLTVPLWYQIESSPQARLFFPNGQIPTQSQCCMKNTTELFAKLQIGSQISTNNSYPIGLYLDEEDVLFSLDYISGYLFGYDANNLTTILSIKLNVSYPVSLVYNDGYFYIGLRNNTILIVNRINQTVVNNINSPYFSGIRDMIFLENGEIMILTSATSGSIIFFRRINNSPTHYSFSFNQSLSSIKLFGLFYVNDTFLLATSWINIGLYSLTQVNSTFWEAKLIVNVSLLVNGTTGAYVTMDRCRRLWYPRPNAIIFTFDQQGTHLGSFIANSIKMTFEILVTQNNILYVADTGSGRIVRIDPNTPG